MRLNRSLFLCGAATFIAICSSAFGYSQSCTPYLHSSNDPARQSYSEGNYKVAEETYTDELAKHPHDAALSAGLVQTLLREGELARAATQATKSLAANPQSAIALTAQAEVLLRQGQPWLALDALASATKLNACYARAHLVRSRIFRIDSRYASERAEIQAAYDIDPADPDIRHAWLSTVQVTHEIESIRKSLTTGAEVDTENRQKALQYISDQVTSLTESNQTCKVTPVLTQEVSMNLVPAFHEMDPMPDVKRDYGSIRPTEAERRISLETKQLVGYKLDVSFEHSKASLIIDTAASGVVITRAIANANGWTASPNDPPGTVHADALQVGALEFKDCTIAVSDTPFADKGDGFIGADMFSFALIDLNQPARRITLSPLPTKGAALPGDRPGSDAGDPLPSQLEGFTPVFHRRQYLLVPVTLNNRLQRLFAVDTGSRLSTLSPDVAHAASDTKVNFTNSFQTTSGSTLQIYRDAFDFQFGSLVLPRQSHILDFEPAAVQRTTEMQLGGLLGFDMLQSLRMQIDYRDGLIKFSAAKQDSSHPKVDSRLLNAKKLEGVPASGSLAAMRGGHPIELSLSTFKNKSDTNAQGELTDVRLTVRVSPQQLQIWKAAMPGERSRRALMAMADAAEFLDLPDRELSKSDPLDDDAQALLLEKMNTYVDKTIAALPNFFASQDVSTFQTINRTHKLGDDFASEPLHYAGLVTAKVRYYQGREILEDMKGEMSEPDQVRAMLLFSGQFGPVLNTVLADAQQDKVAWSHWESRDDKTLAVFRYSVSRNKSHCKFKVVLPANALQSDAESGYHGEIAVDPASGAILRLTLIADLDRDDLMSAANLMVEYGPVELGGRMYICPIRSVTFEAIRGHAGSSRQPSLVSTESSDFGSNSQAGTTFISKGEVFSESLMNDVVFNHFQILRSDVQMMSGAKKVND